ncbi:TetR family transcriptional regulator [Microbacterium sp. B2969]|uniref:TetR family transcriptional regulator n=1 Tax=Microbacterium alkaliflavum TaxID=3248839 RepID=A0ABW7QCJ2_9MICO
MEFQRARSDAQRDERRRVILQTTARMLTQMPVAELSLNEISRRVGLAKSNVLRYYESREAILLELLNVELQDWAAALDAELTTSDRDLPARAEHVAKVVARSMDQRPVMCDLISSQASVLERNISAGLALEHKRLIGESVATLVRALRRALPELDDATAYRLVAMTLISASGAWPQSHPSPAVLEAYALEPSLQNAQLSFTDAITEYVEVGILGLIARQP